MPKEIDTKFKITDPKALKESLKKIGAAFISKNLEQDTYYLSPKSNLALEVIRLRNINGKGIFTLKKAQPFKGSYVYKIRNELEVDVSDPQKFNQMLLALGFKPIFVKEKVRHTYRFGGANICIDELPYLGFYLEIEGTKSKIRIIAKKLNLDIKKAIAVTYLEIFKQYNKRRHKINKNKLIFMPAHKKRY